MPIIKKYIVITITIEVICCILVYVVSLSYDEVLFLYSYFPIVFLGVGYGFKNITQDSAWLAAKICSPAWIGFIVLVVDIPAEYFISILSLIMTITISLSILILENSIYKIRHPI